LLPPDEWKPVTQWLDCELFCKEVESAYIVDIPEGNQVFVEGHWSRKYERTIGKEKGEWAMTEIVSAH
jgi:hypothetical protein